jgi:hypothetical protein
MSSNCFICGWPDDPGIDFCPGCWHPKPSQPQGPTTIAEVVQETIATNRRLKAQNEINRAFSQLYADQMAGDETTNVFVVHSTWEFAVELANLVTVAHDVTILDDDVESPLRLYDGGSMSQWLVNGDFRGWIGVAYLPFFGGIIEGQDAHNDDVLHHAVQNLGRAYKATIDQAGR